MKVNGNPKAESRCPREGRRPKSEAASPHSGDSDFGFRISDFNPWLLWQLADSAFPTGGFAHSAGLEAAWQHGEIRTATELRQWLFASLNQLACTALPFVNAAFAEPQRLTELDQLFDAFTSNHVANRASRLQGKALLGSAERIFNGSMQL